MPEITTMRTTSGKWLRGLGWLLASILVVEMLLQVAAWAVGKHSTRSPDYWMRSDLRVLALGDSNTYGLYLKPEEAYPAQLEALWNNAHPHQRVEIINLGYPGTNSFRLLANLPDILNTFQPDVVLLMIGFNDFWTPAETPARDSSPSVINWLRIHSRVYKLFFMLHEYIRGEQAIDTGERQMGAPDANSFTADEMQQLENATGLTAEQLKHPPAGLLQDKALAARLDTALKTIMEERERTTQKDILNTVKYGDAVFSLGVIEGKSAGNSKEMVGNLKAMLKILENYRVKTILLDYPTAHGYYPAANRKIRQVVEETGVSFISLAAVLPESCRKDPDVCPDLLYFDAHATAQGNALVAKHVLAGMETYLPVKDKNARLPATRTGKNKIRR